MRIIPIRRLPFAIAGTIAVLFGTLGATSLHAVDKNWTGKNLTPIWATFSLNNWSGILSPTRFDTAIFGTQFTPSPFDPLFRVNPNGSQILLERVLPFVPGPIANNIIFLNNWTLTEPATGLLGRFAAPLTLEGGDITVMDGRTATINADVILNSGQLTKLGNGTLLLERKAIGNVLVLQGTLGGNFFATGSLANFANLSPGPGISPGAITVGGTFAQTRTGSLNIEVASPTSFSQLLVAGNAHLGGNLNVSLLDGYFPKQGQKITFLSAAGISGEFNEVNAPVWDLLTLRPVYGKDTVTLKAVINSFDALPGLTPNEHAVAQDLDKVIFDSRASRLVNYLYGRDFSDLPGQYDRIAPAELTSIYAMGVALENVQSLNLQRRTEDIRSGSAGFSAERFSLMGSAPSYSGNFDMASGVAGPNGNSGKEVKETKEVAPGENRWGAFLSGTGEWVNVTGTDNARGYDIASGGFTLGVDYKVCPNFAIGLAAGYTGTTADLTNHGRVWVNGGKLGLYATTFAGGWYADMAAFGGYNSYDTRRGALQGDARGDTDGGEINALFGTGYDFKAGALTFGPTATFNYTYVGLNGFDEHGSLAPLDIHGGNENSLRSAFGVKISYDCKCHGVIIRPELRVAWQHEYGDSVYDITSSFANGAGDTFSVAGPRLGRDSALVGAGFAILFNDRCSTYIYYDGELGRENYESNAVTAGFRVAF
ncbi:MAG TPA: autotransporter outer membrane beta-barrel domain-containing protein [Chthoniobacter sp.]|jgi:outer membrane autotransporter protein